MVNLFERIQKAVDYIEEGISREISLLDIAGKASCSLYHFHRIFRALVGNSVKEYLRKRRLTFAAEDLVATRKSILDIALDYQYSTPESFSRAFKKMYGLNPLGYRKRGSFEPLHGKADLLTLGRKLNQKFRGVMKPEIRSKSEMIVLGYLLETKHDSCADDTVAFWKEFKAGELGKKIPYKKNPDEYYAVCYGVCDGCVGYKDGNLKTGEQFGYLICSEVEGITEVPAGMVLKKIPASKYAVFTALGGAAKSKEVADYIFKTWLPNTSYELANAPDLERYSSDWPEGSDAKMEIWIPILQ